MSQAPHVIRGMRWGVGLGEGKLEDSLMVALLDSYCGLYMANTAELYAGQHGVTREMQDEFAMRSQKLADNAYKAGRLQEEITPVQCAIAKASQRERSSPRTIIAVLKRRWRAWLS